jgi:DNA mismatch repair protein MutS2
MNREEKLQIDSALETLDFGPVLESVANYALTSYGFDRIMALRPYRDDEAQRFTKSNYKFEREFDEIEALLGLIIRGHELPLAGIRNLEDALLRAEMPGTALSERRLLDISRIAQSASDIKIYLEGNRLTLEVLIHYSDEIEAMPLLQREIGRKIDSDSAELYDHASPELSKIRKAISSTERKTRTKLASLAKKFGGDGMLLDSATSVWDGRHVLAVIATHKSKVHGIVHGLSASGGTVFIEPNELVILGNEMRRLVEEESEEVHKILVEITDVVRDHLLPLNNAVRIIGILDSLQGRARYAEIVGAMRPAIRPDELSIVNGRHPLLVTRKGLDVTVPLDLKLVKESRVLVITGPNAGGKTVALKTVGLITALIHSGIWPPCGDGTVVPPMDMWHVIIGDDQSLEGDLSSFSGHLGKLKEITDEPGMRKLVLIDEIAAGTDPTEGAALAMALLEEASKWGWWTLVSTHMGALKAFAHKNSEVRNGSMQFDKEALTPTYKFQPDMPGSSYALEIAARVGLPAKLIERSRELVGDERLSLEDLISEMSVRLHTLEKRERELVFKQSETDGLKKLLQERLDTFEAKKAEKVSRAAGEAEMLLANANRTIELAVKQIREEQASKEAIKKAHERMNQQRDAVEKALKKSEEIKLKVRKKVQQQEKTVVKPPNIKQTKVISPQAQQVVTDEILPDAPINVGDEVRTASGIRGEVLALKPKEVQVAAGSVKVWIKIDQLEKVHKTKAINKTPVQIHMSSESSDSGPVSTELKLLGMRYEAAEEAVERYLEQLALAGLKMARIVHGKGSGTLRAMVQDLVATSPLVEKYRYGQPQEGGDGVTIVILSE